MQNQDGTIAYIRQERLLDEETLQKVIEEQQSGDKSLINILKDHNLIDEAKFTQILAAGNGIEFVNLSSDMVESLAAHMVTYDLANKHNIIPIKKDGTNLLVAMSNPLNLTVRDQIEMRTGLRVIPRAATPNAITQAIRYHFSVQNQARQTIASMRLKNDGAKDQTDAADLESKSLRNANDPITKLVSSIITGAIDARASDIHIEPQKPDMKVRYRVDGLLRDALSVPSTFQREVVSHIKVLAEMDISERRIPQDGHITFEHDRLNYDLRISSLPGVGGEKIVIRVLDKSSNNWSLDKIVTSPEDNRLFRKLAANPYGMLLLTGPTGSGKTTTLYSVLQLLNQPEKNIITVEDPVEYCLDGITQVQVTPAAGVTFASTLRSALRQDPDIILVGEIRDLETAEIAISAALTGHLVLSTLHTNDAAGAVSRLINIGIAPFLVASAILGAVAQRLMRTTCPKCKQPYTPDASELEQLGVAVAGEGVTLYRGQGCDACYQAGYLGRQAIYEVLPVTSDIRKLIVGSADDDTIKQQAIAEGMRTLRASGSDEVINGTTTLAELHRVVDMRSQ